MFTDPTTGKTGLWPRFQEKAKSLLLQGQTHQPSPWEKRLSAFASGLVLAQKAQAQGGTAAALAGVQETIITIVQIVFSIILVIGLIRVVMKFVNGAPDALSSLGWLVGGVILWFGFQFFKDDLVGTVGGEGGVR